MSDEGRSLSVRINQDWLIAMLGMEPGVSYEVRKDEDGLKYLVRIVNLSPAEWRGAKPC